MDGVAEGGSSDSGAGESKTDVYKVEIKFSISIMRHEAILPIICNSIQIQCTKNTTP